MSVSGFGSETEWPPAHFPLMPRYFFHIRNDVSTDDREGRELAGPEAARELALESARELVCADIKKGWLNLDHHIIVAGEDGQTLFSLTFREAFELRDGPENRPVPREA